MEFVHEALRNKYKNQPIWVVGADPTIIKFPKDFLENKLSIVLGSAYIVFPDGTYNYNDEYKTVDEFWPERFSDYLTKSHIWAFPFYGMGEGRSKEFIEERKPSKLWSLRYRPYPPHGHRPDILTGVGYNAMVELVYKANEGHSGPYGGFATCLHSALYSAILMGCNPIYIIGCGHRLIDGRQYPIEISKYPFPVREIPKFESHWIPYAERGTRAIMEGCRRENITVLRFIDYEGVQAAIKIADIMGRKG